MLLVTPAVYRTNGTDVWHELCESVTWCRSDDNVFGNLHFSGVGVISTVASQNILYSARLVPSSNTQLIFDRINGFASSLADNSVVLRKIEGIKFNSNNTQINYSTLEQKTGQKWIDGKDVYQKSYQGTVTSTTGQEVLDTLSNSTLISAEGFVGGYQLGSPNNSNTYGFNSLARDSSSGDIILAVNKTGWPITGADYYITIKYTKQ